MLPPAHVLTQKISERLTGEQLRAAVDSGVPALRLIPDPSLRLISSDYPVLTIWRAHREDAGSRLEPAGGPEHVVVVRGERYVQMVAVSEMSACLIRELEDGGDWNSALDRLGKINGGKLAHVLSAIVVSGAFAGIAVD